MLEKDVEKRLCKRVQEVGGIAYKFSSPARRSVPDRICIFPDGDLVFAEVKQPNGVVTKLQRHEHKILINLRQTVIVIYDYRDVDMFIRMWERGEFK